MDINIIEYFQGKQIQILNGNSQNYIKKYYSDEPNLCTSKHGIIIKNNNEILSSAVILANGGGTTVHKNSYYIEENSIILCCGDTLFSLELFELKLNWKTKIDDATAFEIYKMYHDFIIHGELSISRINKNGKIIWKKYGSDIFVTIDGKNDFKIINNKIFAESWDGRKYKFDYDGKDEYNV